NATTVANYFSSYLGARGYPFIVPFYDNSFAFHRVWVNLVVGGTNYFLDPAFKVSEPITGINLTAAMGLSTNELVTAAGGTSTTNYVQNLNEAALRAKLAGYTSNLLDYIQANQPNATVEQIV